MLVKILKSYPEIRNGRRVVSYIGRIESDIATGGIFPAPAGEPSWYVNIDGLDSTREAFNFPHEAYPAVNQVEEALQRVRSYVDSLDPKS